MRRRLPALFVSAILLVLVVAPVQARGPQSRHEQTIAFWTPARMAAAVPRDFTYHPDIGFAPAAKPPGTPGGPGGGGGGGGGGGDTGSTTGASWTAEGAVQNRTGKVYFRMGASAYICSGTATTDGRGAYSLVLTAAHCAFDESTGNFATEWMFIPDFDAQPTYECADTRLGCWTASALVVHEGYATAGGFNTQATLHDFAFAVVGPGGHSGSQQLDAAVGTFGLSIPGFTGVGQSAYAFGYPAAQKYKGSDLVYCAGGIFEDPYNDEDTWGLPCEMTGGSSGGPWLSGFNASNQTGSLSSLNSYGYSGVKAMHGPKFNADTADVYGAANGATNTNVIVP
jgi:hypothetical protein